jgi:hypothetical protein
VSERFVQHTALPPIWTQFGFDRRRQHLGARLSHSVLDVPWPRLGGHEPCDQKLAYRIIAGERQLGFETLELAIAVPGERTMDVGEECPKVLRGRSPRR